MLPLLTRVRPQQILVPILLLHSTRHLGMMFLTRGATFPGLPPQFAYPAAFGDLLTAALALVAIPLVLRGSRMAKPLVWFFNIFGMVDLLAAITTATIYNAPMTAKLINGWRSRRLQSERQFGKCAKNSSTIFQVCSGCSSHGMWPHLSTNASVEFLISECASQIFASPARSCRP